MYYYFNKQTRFKSEATVRLKILHIAKVALAITESNTLSKNL